jgi:hypothetical protein
MKKKLYETFYIEDLSPEEQNNIYNLYKNSYEKSVGKAWDKYNFFERADNWTFYGDQTGYVAVRIQQSGLYKLAIVGGNPKGILKGIQELNSLNKPIWGMVSSDLLHMMKKLGFKNPKPLLFKSLIKFIPKEVFGDNDFTVNSDGSITFKYEDLGNAKKYFIGNQQYFDFLKSQIKDKINPMKFMNLLKEILLEAKQVGNLYHFTPINYCIDILKSQHIVPNDENQISTSRYANSDTGFISHGDDNIMCRIMLDGDKISTKYKIQGFVHPSDIDNSYGDDGLDYEDRKNFLKRKGAKGKYAEEAIITDGRKFYLIPYIKRIDIFIKKQPNKKQQRYLEVLNGMLNKMNIPSETYQGTPQSNTPYKQSKEGNPSQIQYNPKPQEIKISNAAYLHPYPNFKTYTFTNNSKTYPLPDEPSGLTDKKQYMYRNPFIFEKWDLTPLFPDYYVRVIEKSGYDFQKSNPDFKEAEEYRFGSDYRDPISKKIKDSIKFKTWEELGLQSKIEDIDKKLKKYDFWGRGDGLAMLPKNIVDKYLIPTLSTADGRVYSQYVIPKK